MKSLNRIGRALAEMSKVIGFASAWRAYHTTDEAEDKRRMGVVFDTAKKAAELIEEEMDNECRSNRC